MFLSFSALLLAESRVNDFRGLAFPEALLSAANENSELASTDITGYYSSSWDEGSLGFKSTIGAAITSDSTDVAVAIQHYIKLKDGGLCDGNYLNADACPPLQGEKYLTLGVGKTVWSPAMAAGAADNDAATKLKNAGYVGIIFDVERTSGSATDLNNGFWKSIKAFKKAGLGVGLTTSHTGPRVAKSASVPGELVIGWCKSRFLDFISPQMYSGSASSLANAYIETTFCENDGCTWSNYKNCLAKVVPSLLVASWYPEVKTWFKTKHDITTHGFFQWKPVLAHSAAPTSAPTFGCSGCHVYTVKSGDSLYSISVNYPGVSYEDICSCNKIDCATAVIWVGEKLEIPCASSWSETSLEVTARPTIDFPLALPSTDTLEYPGVGTCLHCWTYTVKAGDTVDAILRDNFPCTSYEDLVMCNGIDPSTGFITIGEVLDVPCMRTDSCETSSSSDSNESLEIPHESLEISLELASTCVQCRKDGVIFDCHKYTVRSGDTIKTISRKFRGVSYGEICVLNGIKNCDTAKLTVGEVLEIPCSWSVVTTKAPQLATTETLEASHASTCFGCHLYKVESGDTIYKISLKYPGVTYEEICSCNGINCAWLPRA